MAGRPNLQDFSQASSEALENLKKFRTENPLLTTTIPPSPASPSQHSPVTTSTPQFDSSWLCISPTACRHGKSPDKQHSPTSHMPGMASQLSNPHPQAPQVYHEPLTRITRDMVFDRIYLLLGDNLPKWWTRNPEALVHLTSKTPYSSLALCFTNQQEYIESMANLVIRSGQYDDFGPYGLSSLTQISVCIGHEGIYHYMCLAVHPSSCDVRIIFRGDLCEREGQDPIIHHDLMALCRKGFDRAANRVHADTISRIPRTRSAK